MLVKDINAVDKDIQSYLPIYLETLRLDTVLDFDLYIRLGDQPVLYRSKNLPFTNKTKEKLLESRVTNLYVRSSEKVFYQQYIEQNLNLLICDDSVPEPKKAGILYETSKNLVKDVLSDPTLGENIHRSKNLVATTVEFILQSQKAFMNLVKISSFDYYTYTHSVNVCTFTVALAQKIGITDRHRLGELGIGTLLHDVGKIKIPERILNKKSALNPTEFEVMKKHPGFGKSLLQETRIVKDESFTPIIQHHERLDGSGYPRGLKGSAIHDYGKIISIADVYDALTTKRVYQDAMTAYPAFCVMFNMKGKFEEKFLKAFTELLGPENYKLK